MVVADDNYVIETNWVHFVEHYDDAIVVWYAGKESWTLRYEDDPQGRQLMYDKIRQAMEAR
jgi:hypothetical protein